MAKHLTEHERYQARLKQLYERSEQAKVKTRKRRFKHHVGSRIPQLKHHLWRSSTKRIFALFGIYLLILLTLGYIISPLSKVQKVTVTGNDDLSVTAVKEMTTIKEGRYIWGMLLTAPSEVRRAKVRHPEIKTFSVKLTGPQSVAVKVTENARLGTVYLHGRYYELFADGQMARTKKTMGIDYRNFGKRRSVLRDAARQVGQMPSAVRRGISSISYSPTKLDGERMLLVMNDGNTVYARLSTMGNRMKYYPAIAATMSDKGVVDLQFGAYSYLYGHRNDPAATSTSSSSSMTNSPAGNSGQTTQISQAQ